MSILKISINIGFSKEIISAYSQEHVRSHTTMHCGRNKATLGRMPQTTHTRSSSTVLEGLLTLKVVVP